MVFALSVEIQVIQFVRVIFFGYFINEIFVKGSCQYFTVVACVTLDWLDSFLAGQQLFVSDLLRILGQRRVLCPHVVVVLVIDIVDLVLTMKLKLIGGTIGRSSYVVGIWVVISILTGSVSHSLDVTYVARHIALVWRYNVVFVIDSSCLHGSPLQIRHVLHSIALMCVVVLVLLVMIIIHIKFII